MEKLSKFAPREIQQIQDNSDYQNTMTLSDSELKEAPKLLELIHNVSNKIDYNDQFSLTVSNSEMYQYHKFLSAKFKQQQGFDTMVFDYSIQNTDKEEYYAMLNFEVQFGQKTYSSELVSDEFYWTLPPDEKRDASYAIQVGKGINQIILNVKDQTTKKTLWSIPLDLTPYKIKYHTSYSNLIQE